MKISKGNKFLYIGATVLILLILLFVSLGFSYLKNGPSSWLCWQAFVYPLGIWVICTPLFILYLYFKSRKGKGGSSQLASSQFMNEQRKKSLFKNYTTEDTNPAGFIIKTQVKKGNFAWTQVEQPGHANVIGSTGSGKTALLLNATIRTLGISKDKPSMIFADPKGELYNTHSQFLKDKGYEIISINLRDVSKSANWNPLDKVWDLWHEEKKEEALSFLAELTSSIFVSDNKSDLIWTGGADTIFRFMVISLLELEEKMEMTREHFNITNILYNIQNTTYDELQKVIKMLPDNSKALSVGGRNIRGAENTVNGMVQTCVTTLSLYNDPIIKHVTSKTSWKFNLDEPQAIFLIVPDESKSKYPFVSLFVAETYKELIGLASSMKGKLSRRFYYLLDEFGNFPKIPGMDSMITVARSRNIFFMLLLQSYAQLDEKYGKAVASTILSNCAYEYFLLTADPDTAKRFSTKLGQKQITSRSRGTSSNTRGINTSTNESDRAINLINPDELMRMPFGEFILSMQRELPIRSTLAKFWEAKISTPGAFIPKNASIDNNYDENHLKMVLPDEVEEDIEMIEGNDDELFDSLMEELDK